MLPLVFAKPDRELVIKDIRGNSCCKGRLLEQGFCVGKKLCLMRDGSDGIIVKLNDCKYALNFGLASKIYVENN